MILMIKNSLTKTEKFGEEILKYCVKDRWSFNRENMA